MLNFKTIIACSINLISSKNIEIINKELISKDITDITFDNSIKYIKGDSISIIDSSHFKDIWIKIESLARKEIDLIVREDSVNSMVEILSHSFYFKVQFDDHNRINLLIEQVFINPKNAPIDND